MKPNDLNTNTANSAMPQMLNILMFSYSSLNINA